MNQPPASDEYAPYYIRYITLVPAGDIVTLLATQQDETLALLRGLSETQAAQAYAPGKWTSKEMLGHMSDLERVCVYRALCIARGDRTPLPGFEQDEYMAHANFNALSLVALIDEFAAVRQASVALFAHLPDAAWLRRGIANGQEISVRALMYVIAGHELYHRALLQTRYLA